MHTYNDTIDSWGKGQDSQNVTGARTSQDGKNCRDKTARLKEHGQNRQDNASVERRDGQDNKDKTPWTNSLYMVRTRQHDKAGGTGQLDHGLTNKATKTGQQDLRWNS